MGAGWIGIIAGFGGLLLGGGGLAALLTWRTQSRSVPRNDTVAERRMDLEQSESTNRILTAALDFFKVRNVELEAENTELRTRLHDCEARHDHR